MRFAFAVLGISAAEETASGPAAAAAGPVAVFDPGFIDASVDPCRDLYGFAGAAMVRVQACRVW